MNVRNTLTSLGFTESGGDMQEIWTSPRSPSGVWFEVTFEDLFKSVQYWSRHTVLEMTVIDAPPAKGV